MTLNRYEKVDMFATQTQRTDKRIINLIKTLIKFGRVKINDKSDFLSVYDNLDINAEIIDSDNISEYGNELLTHNDFLQRQFKKLKNKINKDDSIFLVLNYYDEKGIYYNWGLIGSDSFAFQNR